MAEPQITTKDVVLRLDEKVDGLIRDMADVKVIASTVGTTVETLHDHEMRIRSLERWKWGLPVSAVGAVAAVLAAIFH